VTRAVPKSGKPGRGQRTPAATRPIARVCVDVPLAHLDRLFDYQVPAEFDDAAVPGCRVRVRFAGQLVDGFVIERAEQSEHAGRLAFLERVTSAEPVLGPELAKLARAVADRYAGTMIDVLRLAIPPRHAKAENDPPAEPPARNEPPDTQGWQRYPRGPAYLDALKAGRNAHAVWQALPGEDWPSRLAELAATVAAEGRGSVLVVPDHRDLARLREACERLAGKDAVVALSADLGPARRYRAWLAASRGTARIVIGTRATAFAPVADPALLVVWDDGDDLLAEQRSPYPHVRDVLIQRAHLSGAALLVAGFARTAEAQLLVDTGWAHPIEAGRDAVRASMPRVTSVGEHDGQLARDPAAHAARLPSMAFDAARAALKAGAPVLVQVPRRGYVPSLSCAQCRAPARCRRCAGPLALPVSGGEARLPRCRWCGVTEAAFSCGTCGSKRLRAVVVGDKRTAEELGRAFAGVPVRTSGAGEVLSTVDAEPALVVATPGAEPVAAGGYGAVLLLDGWALLSRPDLRASEETLRRWMTAAALAKPSGDGGRVVVIAESGIPTVQALVRWDPVWHASLELAGRTELGFPPAVRMASVDGSPDALAAMLDELALPDTGEILGPVPIEGETDGKERALVRVRRAQGKALAAALAAAQGVRTARKEPDPVRVRLDPLELI
jgi:primosomal protein N' (replication factor Y) (superfamily II helicase)